MSSIPILTLDELREWLSRKLSREDKLLLVLATFDAPCQVHHIKERARQCGLRAAAKWNVSQYLSSSGLSANTATGWQLLNTGKQHLRNLGVSKLSAAAVQVANDLRAHLANISNTTTRAFAEEAIKCHEAELYRSAIVMSWLAAMDVLHREVEKNHLTAFNAEALRVDPKWKTAKTADDLARMGEADFLDRLAAISVIGKNKKAELQKALTLRNGCGHPNSLKVGANISAGHIELLLLNVFNVFSV